MGRGAVSTVLIQNGTLHVGDPFVIGVFSGKVRAMFDDQGEPLEVAGPSHPVEVLGISGVPSAGDPFEGVESDKTAKQISQKRLEYKRAESAKKVKKVTLESLNEMIREGEVQELRIIVKADVDGSCQALKESLEKLSHSRSPGQGHPRRDRRYQRIGRHAGIGVQRGHHRLPRAADRQGLRDRGDVRTYRSSSTMSYSRSPTPSRRPWRACSSPRSGRRCTGSGEVKQVFKISKVGTIAGACPEFREDRAEQQGAPDQGRRRGLRRRRSSRSSASRTTFPRSPCRRNSASALRGLTI